MYDTRVPAKGDHDARREDVSAAVWAVLAAKGFGGLTLRAVAAQMGASTGLLTHYFATKRDLVHYALGVADERTAARALADPEVPGLAGLRAALLHVLTANQMNRVWVSSWDAALGDPELANREAARYARWRRRLREHVRAAQENGDIAATENADDIVATAASFTHGLVVQALFDQRNFPLKRRIRLLDQFLAAISTR
jgi:AcrR family transcriptional regulator